MDKEYIERAAIIPALEDYYEPIDPAQPMTLTLGQIAEVVENMPAADVVERRYLRWETVRDPYGNVEGFLCECGHQSLSASKYCPECGANMWTKSFDGNGRMWDAI